MVKSSIVVLVLLSSVLLFCCNRSHDNYKFHRSEYREIKKAIKYACRLEEILWENEKKINERKDVLSILREGFCERKAQELTDYLWIEEKDSSGKRAKMLRAGDPVLIMPNSIEVVIASEYEATVLLKYKENPEGPLTWKAHINEAILKKENGVWKIHTIERY